MQTRSNLELLVLLTMAVTTGPANAIALKDLAKCYTREYSMEELDTVRNIDRLSLAVDAAQSSVTLTGKNRLGQFGFLQFSCSERPGNETTDPSCGTFEWESSISITERANGDIIVLTTNAYLSDIGGLYWFEYPHEDGSHHIFNLEGNEPEAYGPIGAGPRNYSVLSPADPSNCPVIGSG